MPKDINRDTTNITKILEDTSKKYDEASHVKLIKSLPKNNPAIDQGEICIPDRATDIVATDTTSSSTEVSTMTSKSPPKKSSSQNTRPVGRDKDGICVSDYGIQWRSDWVHTPSGKGDVWITPKAKKYPAHKGRWTKPIHMVPLTWTVQVGDRKGPRIRADGTISKGEMVPTLTTGREALEVAARYWGIVLTEDQLPHKYEPYRQKPTEPTTTGVSTTQQVSLPLPSPLKVTPPMVPELDQLKQAREDAVQQVRVILDQQDEFKKERTRLLTQEQKLKLLKHETLGSLRAIKNFGVAVDDLLAVLEIDA